MLRGGEIYLIKEREQATDSFLIGGLALENSLSLDERGLSLE